MSPRPRQRILLLTAVAAIGSTLPSSSYAFVPPGCRHTSMPVGLKPCQTRLFSSTGDEGGWFGGLKKAAKSFLPKSWTQTEEERKATIIRKEIKNEMKSGIKAMLKDAPLAIRMVGSLVAPILSSLASTMQEQQKQTQDLLDDARDYILSDPSATLALGEPFVVQPPFSQSSSTVSINGQSSSQIQASFYVQGTRELGVATMVASDKGIQSLSLNVGGRTLNISLYKSAGVSSNVFGSSQQKSGVGKNRINKNDIIDVEFVEKDKK